MELEGIVYAYANDYGLKFLFLRNLIFIDFFGLSSSASSWFTLLANTVSSCIDSLPHIVSGL